jgi:hypothetical protein
MINLCEGVYRPDYIGTKEFNKLTIILHKKYSFLTLRWSKDFNIRNKKNYHL